MKDNEGWIKFKGSRSRHVYRTGDRATICGLKVHDDDIQHTNWLQKTEDVFRRMRCMKCLKLMGMTPEEAKHIKTPVRVA